MKNLQKIASILLLLMASQSANAYNYILCGATPVYAGEPSHVFWEGSNLFASEVTATQEAFARLSAYSKGVAVVGPLTSTPALGNSQ